MAKRKPAPEKKAKLSPRPRRAEVPISDDASRYAAALQSALDGELEHARSLYEALAPTLKDSKLKALVLNDQAAIAAVEGRVDDARQGIRLAIAADPACVVALENSKALPPSDAFEGASRLPAQVGSESPARERAIRVAILSFLFNWPSTGGGIVHTVELAKFLSLAGYSVRHFYADHQEFGVGKVGEPLPFDSRAIRFDVSSWNRSTIQARYREAVTDFDPDYVVITDSWNFKPLLAEAVRPYPTILRFQAMECLCPLNNVRLLFDGPNDVRQCNFHQLATPDECHKCLGARAHMSGLLHRTERALAGVGTPDYDRILRETVREARAVLVVNPLQQAMFAPYARDVRVIPSGFDPARFPWPTLPRPEGRQTTIFCAALVHEPMKGFPVLHQACQQLWQKRKDFQLVVTGDPPGQVDEFTRFVGWQTQDDLPRHFSESDICAVPTIAQEALGRTAVEAMASGIPVVASNLGGLPFTVTDGLTGLLVEPGNPNDLAAKLDSLLDDAELRRRMGEAGRKRFETSYTWTSIIEREYRTLLSERRNGSTPRDNSQQERKAGIDSFRKEFHWPGRCPSVPIPRENLGWFQDGAQEALSSALAPGIEVVLEMGAWLGMSTRYIADRAPQAMVVTIDHFQGSPEHLRRPEWRAMLPTLFETFQALNWSYRDRIVPLRMTTHEGLRAVHRHGIAPDVIFFDADHRYEVVANDLELVQSLFPKALLVGDDYDDPDVQRAVTEFAVRRNHRVEIHGRQWRGWILRHRA